MPHSPAPPVASHELPPLPEPEMTTPVVFGCDGRWWSEHQMRAFLAAAHQQPAALSAEPQAGNLTGSKWHHKSNPFDLYTVLHEGKLQTAEPAPDMTEVVVYAGPTGVWVRPTAEFLDGRFHGAGKTTPATGMAEPEDQPQEQPLCPFCKERHAHCDSPGAIITGTTGCPKMPPSRGVPGTYGGQSNG